MKMQEDIKLIDGQFTPKEAKELLINMYSIKLQFHHMKNLSAEARFGQNDVMALKRIRELEEAIKRVTDIIKDAELENNKIVIKSTLRIAPSKK